jgi:hypothetical protein
VAYGRYGQAMYANVEQQRELNDSWNDGSDKGLSQPRFSKGGQKHHPEQELVKGFKRLLHRHHDNRFVFGK